MLVKTIITSVFLFQVAFSYAQQIAEVGIEEEDILDLFGDDETVSISTGTNKPLRLAPSVATVITQQDIERSGATNLDQVLEMVPGLHVAVSSSNLLNSIYSIRGIHTSQNPQVLLLIDNAPVQQLFSGGRPSRFLLPVANIKRVEVIRGPGSAVFGADAFAGVINVITKGANEIDGVQGGVRYGSFDTKDIWLQAATRTLSDWQFTFSLEYQASDGDDDRIIERDLQSTFDDFGFGPAASLAPGALNTSYETYNMRVGVRNEQWDVYLSIWDQNDAGVGAGGAQALDPVGSVDIEYYTLGASYKDIIAEDWRYEIKFNANFSDEQRELVLLPPGSTVPIGEDGNLSLTGQLTQFTDGVIGNPGGKENRNHIEWINHFTGLEKHKLRAAFGFQWQDFEAKESKNFGPGVITNNPGVIDGTIQDVTGTQFAYAPDVDRQVWFLSLQDEWKLAPDWELTVGLRYDDYSDFGSTVNPRLALVWSTTYNLSTKLLYGRAFRAPSFAELFAVNNPVVLGNPDLDPEKIDTLELAFDYRPTANLTTKLNIYTYKLRDLIDYVPSVDIQAGALEANNVFDQNGYGFELEASYKLGEEFELEANYAWQHSEIDGTDSDIADAPGEQFSITTNWGFVEGWRLGLGLNFVGDRARAAADNRPSVDGYTTVDLKLQRYQLLRDLDIALIGRNIFDENGREPAVFSSPLTAIPGDFPIIGRSITAEVKYHFK